MLNVSNQNSFNPAAPGAIGGTTPAAGAFTTLASSGIITEAPRAGGYKWTDWDPSDVAGTPTNAPSTGTAVAATNYMTIANSSGTVTFTFTKAGNYRIGVFGGNEMAAAPTGSTFLSCAVGGTATRQPTATSIRLVFGNGTFYYGSMSGSAVFLVMAAANQTLTLLPTMTVTSGGVTTNFTTECNCSATYVGT